MSQGGGTTIHTECTCSIPTATMTPTWRRSSPTHRQSTTAPSLMDWNQPPTTWTSMLAQGGLPTGQSSILVPLTPGYRPADPPVLHSSPASFPDVWGRASSKNQRAHKDFVMNFTSVFVLNWMCLYGSIDQWQMERGNVCQRRKQGNVLVGFLFFTTWMEWRRNHAGGLLMDKPGHCRREMCVLLCLDVSFIFIIKLVAVIAWWKVWVTWTRVCEKSRDGKRVCAEAKTDQTHVCKNKSTRLMLECTEGWSCICT